MRSALLLAATSALAVLCLGDARAQNPWSDQPIESIPERHPPHRRARVAHRGRLGQKVRADLSGAY